MLPTHRDRDWIVNEHKRRNASTQPLEELFTDHRAQVTLRISKMCRSSADRLCLLGAGNCNDIDLVELLRHFQSITLFDLDRDSVAVGVERQMKNIELRSRVQIADSIDLSGMLEQFSKPIDEVATTDSLSESILSVLKDRDRMTLQGGPFDCIASCCLMSQMIDSLVFGMGETHPAFVPAVLALRKQHLFLIADALVGGGRGLLVFDFVSSQTLPQLTNCSPEELPQILMMALQSRNFFTGLNPFAVQAELTTAAEFQQLIKDITLSQPWRWNIGVKCFGVTAIGFEKNPTG